MIANMPARRIVDDKRHYDDGAVMQVLVWEVPKSVAGSAHRISLERLFEDFLSDIEEARTP